MLKKIGVIGLGKMGQNMVLNLLSKNYEIVVYNRSPEPIKQIQKNGAIPSFSLEEFINKLPEKKIIIVMVTAGKPVDEIINQLIPLLAKEDIIIDGGNSYYKDSIKRYLRLKKKGIYFIDMGISGGLEGARHGASLMIGGGEHIFKKIEYLFQDIATKNGYAYLGSSGAGHFIKMIHNGIEYALLEAYSEGFETLEKSKYKLNYKDIARVWNNGSIIESKILKYIEDVFKKDHELKSAKGIIGGGETGTWALETAKELKSDFGTLDHALKKRKSSKKKQSFSTKLISLVRHEFGGHDVS